MATTFLESGTDATQGFEFYAVTVGTVTSDTVIKKTGPRSAKFTSGAGGELSYAYFSGPTTASGRVSVNWYQDGAPTNKLDFLETQTSAVSGALAIVAIKSTGVLNLAVDDSVADVTGSTVTLGTWNRIALVWTVTSATVYTVKVFLNGVLDMTVTNRGTLNTTTIGLVVIGWVSTGEGNSLSNHFDDVYADDSAALTDPDNILVTNKRPNANGTLIEFTTQIGAGGSGYGSGHSPQVNEQPLSTTNGWSVIAVAVNTEEYNIESAATGDVNISGLALVDYMGWVYTKALIAETGKIRVNNVDTNISITTANKMFTKAAGSTTYPAGTGTDIGELTDATATTVSLYECGILFAYKPATDTLMGAAWM